jgi:transcriptional regulator with XRE-family HTH domain
MAFEPKHLIEQREAKGWSQSALARKAAVSRSAISHWETGRGAPDEAQAKRLAALFSAGDVKPAAKKEAAKPAKKAATPAKAKKEAKPAAKAPATVAAWVGAQRAAAKLALDALAEQAGLTPATVGSIEQGKAPWPRKRTRRRLEKVLGALPAQTAARAKDQARVDGFGVLTDFNPHDPEDRPKAAGVFVLYDGASRPVHVGQSKNARKRLEALSAEAWFKAPTVEQAAFLEVDEGALREAVESLLVRTLRGALLVRTRHAAE